MIHTISDLLEQLQKHQLPLLEAQNIQHTGTIGDMYEGLTSALLSKSLPANLGLEVHSGFVRNSSGQNSKQLDCMVTVGGGKVIPYSTRRVFNIHDVVAVVEVKKNLFSDTLAEGVQNLVSLLDLGEQQKDLPVSLFRDAFIQVIGEDPLLMDAQRIAENWQSTEIGSSLYQDAATPARIVFGFDGFTSEYSLRKKFVEFLKKQMLRTGMSDAELSQIIPVCPPALPSLIICKNASLVKANGMPYGFPMLGGNWWPCYASYGKTPFRLLLEVIFTRLHYYHGLDRDVFGDDLEHEVFNPLLCARPVRLGDKVAWEYDWMERSKKELEVTQELSGAWAPSELSREEYTVLMQVLVAFNGGREPVTINEDSLLVYLAGRNLSIDDIIKSFRDKRLATVEGGEFVLLTQSLQLLIDPDGLFRASTDDIHLSNWLQAQEGKGRAA